MKLRKWIYRNGHTLTSFSKMMGISRSHINMLIAGKRNASRELVIKIRLVTGGKVKYFADLKDEEKTL